MTNLDDHCANVSTQTEPVHYNKSQHSTRSIERGKCINQNDTMQALVSCIFFSGSMAVQISERQLKQT